jgi:hypothetical protein
VEDPDPGQLAGDMLGPAVLPAVGGIFAQSQGMIFPVFFVAPQGFQGRKVAAMAVGMDFVVHVPLFPPVDVLRAQPRRSLVVDPVGRVAAPMVPGVGFQGLADLGRPGGELPERGLPAFDGLDDSQDGDKNHKDEEDPPFPDRHTQDGFLIFHAPQILNGEKSKSQGVGKTSVDF